MPAENHYFLQGVRIVESVGSCLLGSGCDGDAALQRDEEITDLHTKLKIFAKVRKNSDICKLYVGNQFLK